jgi:hypothetical protein
MSQDFTPHDLELTGATKTLTSTASVENTLNVTANTNLALATEVFTLKSSREGLLR